MNRKISFFCVIFLLVLVTVFPNTEYPSFADGAQDDSVIPPAPKAPKFVSAEVTKSQKIKLKWSAVVGLGRMGSGDGIKVFKKTGKGSWKTLVVFQKYSKNIPSTYTDKQVKKNVIYSYRIKAFVFYSRVVGVNGAGQEITETSSVESGYSFAPKVINAKPTYMKKRNIQKAKFGHKTYYLNVGSIARLGVNTGYYPTSHLVSSTKKFMTSDSTKLKYLGSGIVQALKKGSFYFYMVMHNGVKATCKVVCKDYAHPSSVNKSGISTVAKSVFGTYKNKLYDALAYVSSLRGSRTYNLTASSRSRLRSIPNLYDFATSNKVQYIVSNNGMVTIILNDLSSIWFIPYNSSTKKENGFTLKRKATCIYYAKA